MVESESAGLEAVCTLDGAAYCHLSADNQDPEGEGLRPGPRGGGGRVGAVGTTLNDLPCSE